MPSKIAAFFVTLILNIIAGVVIFFMTLVAMNGYSGSDAEWGLIAYIALSAITAILMSSGATVLVHMLLKRQFSALVSAVIAILVFSVIGAALEVVCCGIGIGIAEYVRVNY